MTQPDDDRSVVVDVSQVTRPDLADVDAVARIQLEARRRGMHMRLLGANARLCELLALTGLTEAVAVRPDLPVRLGGQPEEWEEPGVEEVRDVGDPTA